MSHEKKPKYSVGQLVDFCGNRAIITKIKEQDYFYGMETTYYEYTVELTATGALHTVFEAALSPLDAYAAKKCECGAWAVHWATEEHSDWCPLSRSKNEL